MRTEQELIEKAEQLFEKEDYQAIIDLLTDEDLQQFKSAIIYFYLGNAFCKVSKFYEAIEYLSKAISLEVSLINAYNNRGIAYASIGENDKAIEDYSRAIYIKSDYLEAYVNRGTVFAKKGEFDKAKEDYEKAIKIDDKNPIGYFNRGNSWYDIYEYHKAIEDYTIAIYYNSKYAEAFYNRGSCFTEIEEYDKAIKDFIEAIDIDENYAFAYNGRGVAYANLSETEKAINDFKSAIDIDKNYAEPYFNYGLALSYKLEHENAYESFDHAFDLVKNKHQSNINLSKLAPFFHITRSFKDSVKKEEMKKFYINYAKNIDPIIDEIRSIAKYNKDLGDYVTGEKELVAHYTNLKTADVLLNKEGDSKLRYSNAVFVNDPQEGEILINYIDKLQELDKDSVKIKEAFYDVMKKEQNNFYLGSFLPVTNNHEDELIMWRTYGRDEHLKEAAGCSLVLDTSFFDTTDFGYINNYANTETPMPQRLYRVLYYDQRKNEFPQDKEEIEIEVQLKKLKEGLVGLLKMKMGEDSEEARMYNTAIDKVLYHSLSELRYFFKSADFAYENELRVIQYATHKDVVKIDNQSNALPRKVYIESSKPLLPHLKEIVLGPMVSHPERWMYLQKIMNDKGHDFKLRHSNCRFQ